MKSESRQPELPKLPHGDGVLVYTSKCFDVMRRKESEVRAGLQSAGNQPLAVAVDEWLRLYKQPEVKPSSYGRLCITFDSQIKRMAIAGNQCADTVRVFVVNYQKGV